MIQAIGHNPLYAAGLSLIANTAPVAFGAVGIPITVAGKVTSISPFEIGQMAGRQLPLLSLFVPFWLVFIMDGLKGIRETWPAIFVTGGSFALTQFITANYITYELPDITSALVSMISLALFLRVWKPKNIFRFEDKAKTSTTKKARAEVSATASVKKYSAGQIFKAWSPFIILTVMVSLWSTQAFKNALGKFTLIFQVPGLHNLVQKAQPIVTKVTPYAAEYKLDLLAATGTAILFTAIIAKLILNMKTSDLVSTFGETVKTLVWPIITIGLVLGFAFIANYSGLSSTLGLFLAGTGNLFPFFSPMLGWLGVFLTGSDTSSNALFATLQQVTANQIGVKDTLLVAANTTGGVTGKMISPQSIAVATAAVGLIGKESDLFRFTLKHSIFFVIIIGIMTYLQAYVFPWMIP